MTSYKIKMIPLTRKGLFDLIDPLIQEHGQSNFFIELPLVYLENKDKGTLIGVYYMTMPPDPYGEVRGTINIGVGREIRVDGSSIQLQDRLSVRHFYCTHVSDACHLPAFHGLEQKTSFCVYRSMDYIGDTPISNPEFLFSFRGHFLFPLVTSNDLVPAVPHHLP